MTNAPDPRMANVGEGARGGFSHFRYDDRPSMYYDEGGQVPSGRPSQYQLAPPSQHMPNYSAPPYKHPQHGSQYPSPYYEPSYPHYASSAYPLGYYPNASSVVSDRRPSWDLPPYSAPPRSNNSYPPTLLARTQFSGQPGFMYGYDPGYASTGSSTVTSSSSSSSHNNHPNTEQVTANIGNPSAPDYYSPAQTEEMNFDLLRSNEDGRFVCPSINCQHTYSRRGDLKSHFKIKHPDENMFVPSTSQYKGAKEGKKYPCPVENCYCGYYRRQDLRRHFRRKHSELVDDPRYDHIINRKITACPVCGVKFHRYGNYVNHSLRVHGINVEKDGVLRK